MVEGLGGKLEAIYFAFGDVDSHVIVDLPDNVTAAAVSPAVNQSGVVSAKSVILITPEEMDAVRSLSRAGPLSLLAPSLAPGALPPAPPSVLWRPETRARSSTGQSIGLRNRGLGVRTSPGAPP